MPHGAGHCPLAGAPKRNTSGLQGKPADVWHDRAVFHFLTAQADRLAYVAQVRRHVRKGGHVVMATFGPRGPLRCSDLDVVRYDAQRLHDEFGDHFRLIGSRISQHETPAHRHQEFLYCWCRVV